MLGFHARLGAARLVFGAALLAPGAVAVVLWRAAQAQVWSQPATLRALCGRGDVLAGATDGGVVLWDLTTGAARRAGPLCGLPSPQVTSLALDDHDDVLCATTPAGLARGWWEGPWSAPARDPAGRDTVFLCSAPRPGGGALAGGRGGMLAAWVRNELGTLRLPAESAVVALAVAPILVDTGPASVAVAPQFPPGLAAATEGAGLWLLHSIGVGTQWRHLTSFDGLPSDTLRALAADTHGRLWVATSRGLARVRRGGLVDAWPADAVLGGEVLALYCGPDGGLYLGLGTGVARLEPLCEHPCVQLLRGTGGPVRGFAWAGGELWWAECDTARALSGQRRALGLHVQVAGRPGARWQPAPLWPGASAAGDRAAVSGTLQPAGRAPECGAGPMRPGSRGATPLAPGVVQWFDVRGRRLDGPGGARGVYFVRLPATNGARAVRREMILRPRNG